MTIRRRLSFAAASAVAIAVALASVGAYVAVRAKLRGEIDSSLRDRASAIQQVAQRAQSIGVQMQGPPPVGDAARFGGAEGAVQFVAPSGRPRTGGEDFTLPVDPATVSIAKGSGGAKLADEHVAGHHLRVITAPIAGGGAIQVARPLDEVDNVLHGLVLLLAGITIGGVLLAAVLGGVVSRASLRPVERFTEETESIASAPDLGRRLDDDTDDELGRLARSFNTTLESLERSVAAQRHLVADASHELRTPLASLKTNLEVLLTDRELPAEERRELLQDLVEQADELTLLVGDIVDLARRGEPAEAFDDVPVHELVERAVARAQRHAPDVEYDVELEPLVVHGVPERLDRAVSNLLDNAAKWSPTGGTVDVRLRGGELVVRDRGPGFNEDDLPFVFDRFYRASDARKLPGSGLGLAIVRQVAESHGGAVKAENAPGGGAQLHLSFNGSLDKPAPVLAGERKLFGFS
jgi:two-component system, OmpR family, sensor histidine kinase MprB